MYKGSVVGPAYEGYVDKVGDKVADVGRAFPGRISVTE